MMVHSERCVTQYMLTTVEFAELNFGLQFMDTETLSCTWLQITACILSTHSDICIDVTAGLPNFYRNDNVNCKFHSAVHKI